MSDLRARRVAHGISGDVLCGAAKIRRSRLSRLENGYIQASPEEAKHIVQALDRLIVAKQGAEKILRKGGWTSGLMPVAKKAAATVALCLIAGVFAFGQIPISGWGGGGGGGATAASQLTDAKWTRTSATIETLTFPTGGTTFSSNAFRSIVTNGCTITLAAGGAAAGTKFYSYWDPFSNTLKVDVSSANFNNVTVGAGCTASNTGATGYPQDVVPLGTLAAGDNTVDQWNASPLTDTRSVYNVSPYKVGSFLARTYAPSTGIQTVALDTTKLSNPSGTVLATTTGALTSGHVAAFNASGDIVDGGTGSSNIQLDYQKQTAVINVPQDFADHTIYTTTVAGNTLGAGGCIAVDAGFITTTPGGGVLYRLNWAGTTQNIGSFGTNAAAQTMQLTICNNPGVTNAQQMNVRYVYQGGALGPSVVTTPAADTTVSQTVSITANDSNGAGVQVTGLWWRVTK